MKSTFLMLCVVTNWTWSSSGPMLSLVSYGA